MLYAPIVQKVTIQYIHAKENTEEGNFLTFEKLARVTSDKGKFVALLQKERGDKTNSWFINKQSEKKMQKLLNLT